VPGPERVVGAERERRPDHERVAHVQRVRDAPANSPNKLLTFNIPKWILRLVFVKKWLNFHNLAVIFIEASRDIEPPKEGVVGAESERRPDHERVAHAQRVRDAPASPGILLACSIQKWIFLRGFAKNRLNIYQT